MKKNRFILPIITVTVFFSACKKEERLDPIPVLEPVSPTHATRSTYTGTTVEFVYASTTEPPLSGTFFTGNPYADTADTNRDFASVSADTGINAADFADTAIDFGEVFTDIPDRAYSENIEAVTGITAENYADNPDTAVSAESVFFDTADTNS